MWPVIKDIIEQLAQTISKGNEFAAQIAQSNGEGDSEIMAKIQLTFDYS